MISPGKKLRAQAAIIDALILLLVSIAASMLIFNFVGTWGEDQDQVLRSAYVLNYMQSVSKALYYVDSSTLSEIKSDGLDVYEKALTATGFETNPQYDLSSPDYGCNQLKEYPGTLRVTDLMKRDLADSNPIPIGGEMPKLDDKFGNAQVPGRTAVRCALKELMKPFAFSGYKYYFEAILSQQPEASGITAGESTALVHYVGPEITNSKDTEIVGVETSSGSTIKQTNGKGTVVPGCFSAVDKGLQILAVSSPFQVLYSDTSGGTLDSKFIKYKTRICIWQSREDV